VADDEHVPKKTKKSNVVLVKVNQTTQKEEMVAVKSNLATDAWSSVAPKPQQITLAPQERPIKKYRVPAKARGTVALAVAAAAARAAADSVAVALDAADNCIAAQICFETVFQTKAVNSDNMDADLRVVLFEVTDMDSETTSLGQGLERLDAIIEETATHVSELRHGPMFAFLKPGDIDISFAELSNHKCINLHALRKATGEPQSVTPDFARLVRENHALAAIAHSMPKPLSAVHWKSQRLHSPPFILESNLWNVSELHHSKLVPALHEFVRRQMRNLCSFWSDQAIDYDGAKTRWSEALCIWEHREDKSPHPKTRRPLPAAPTNCDMTSPAGEKASRTSLFSLDSSHSTVISRAPVTSRYAPTPIEGDESGGTGAPTRARKALRDESTEHERLVSEVLASSAKEARFERGAVDDEDLPVPLPVSVLAQEDEKLRDSRLSCRVVFDPCEEESRFSKCRQWSDLEKCIFLDKFLQYPKNFRKISAFLTRKRARDCARLYYDSKYAVDYKALLREHQQRRRGVRICWDVAAKAVQTFGGQLNHDPQSNVIWFRLPIDDFSTTTVHKRHSMANSGTRKSSAIGEINRSYHHLPSDSNFSIDNMADSEANRVTKPQRRTMRKQSNTKARPPAARGSPAAKDTKGATIEVAATYSGNPTNVLSPNAQMVPSSAKKQIRDKDELGHSTSRNCTATQKRLKLQQPNQTTPQMHGSHVYAPPGSIRAMQAPHQYKPTTGAFGSHNHGCSFLSQPLSVSPGLSTSTLNLCGQKQHCHNIPQHQKQQNQHRHHQQARGCQLNMVQIQGDPASLLSTYGLPRDKQRRLTYNHLRQVTPMLPILSDGQQYGYQSPPTHFYGGIPGLDCRDPAQHRADAAYVAALAMAVDVHGKVGGPPCDNASASISRGSESRSDGTITSPYVSQDRNEFLGDLRARCWASLGAPSGKYGRQQFIVGMDSQGFGLPPPDVSASETCHIVDSRSSIAHTRVLVTDVLSDTAGCFATAAPHEIPAYIYSPAPRGAAAHTTSSTPDALCHSNQKWTATEKALFLRHLVTHGKNWAVLTHLIPSKTEAQIKNHYQSYRNRLGLQNILSSLDAAGSRVHKRQAVPASHVASASRGISPKPTSAYHYHQPCLDQPPAAVNDSHAKGTTDVEVTFAEPAQQQHGTTISEQLPEYGHIPPIGPLDGTHGLVDAHKGATAAADTHALYQAAALEANAHAAVTEGTTTGALNPIHFWQSCLLATRPSPQSSPLTTTKAILESHASPQPELHLSANKHAGLTKKMEVPQCPAAGSLESSKFNISNCPPPHTDSAFSLVQAAQIQPEWWPGAVDWPRVTPGATPATPGTTKRHGARQ
jgi:hypothetical protein